MSRKMERGIAARLRGPKSLGAKLLRATRMDQAGAAAVEFAFVMPILLLVFSGIVQFGSVLFIENHMTNVAREYSRRVAVGDMTTTQARTEIEGELINWGVTYDVRVFTTTLADGNEDVTVGIQLPTREAALIDVLGIFQTGNIRAVVNMPMES